MSGGDLIKILLIIAGTLAIGIYTKKTTEKGAAVILFAGALAVLWVFVFSIQKGEDTAGIGIPGQALAAISSGSTSATIKMSPEQINKKIDEALAEKDPNKKLEKTVDALLQIARSRQLSGQKPGRGGGMQQ